MKRACWRLLSGEYLYHALIPLVSAAILLSAVPAGAADKPRVVILGFDGMEPSIVDTMLAAGELPNLAALRSAGAYERLHTTYPPQSPAAWSSFATCAPTGDHGIYDFLRRNPKNYLPDFGYGKTDAPRLAADGSLVSPPKAVNYRRGETFWASADRQGAKCKILHVPFSFPPDHLQEGLELSGEGVPDIRGTVTTFFALSDAFTPEELSAKVAGGIRLPIEFQEDSATVNIPAYPDPRQRSNVVQAPLTIKVDRSAHTVSLSAQGQSDTVAEGAWSKWFKWKFDVTAQYSVHAISNFCVIEAGARVRIYMSSLQFAPKQPYVPFSTPVTYSGELEDRAGLYKTIGWTNDTHALSQDALTDDSFLAEAKTTDDWLQALTLDEIKRNDFQLLVSVWTSTDRVAHMFWRFRDPKHAQYTKEGAAKYGHVIEDTYKRMDAIVGAVRKQLPPDALVIVLSDHGFHSFRKGFSVNTWLARNGYLALTGKSDPATAHTEKGQQFLAGFDWSKTKAYGLGLGSIYLNQKGREGQGLVAADAASQLIAELKAKLLDVTDPDTGGKVFSAVYTRDDYHGQTADAPDLQLGYADGYQTSKPSAGGAVPQDVFEINNGKWSGDHASSDVASTAGIFLANKPMTQDARIEDLGVTALTFLGLKVPPEFRGKSLLQQ
ncbi:MAG: alkaline phosphatase family protein [Candidatus Hydrogenedentes bacterium]|nr:alkaline phosphatase family protein [Candidatus Hydrogenedentota bacterium]